MNKLERQAIAVLIHQLRTVTAIKPDLLDKPAYRDGHAFAATRAIETLTFILHPPTPKDLQRFASQSLR